MVFPGNKLAAFRKNDDDKTFRLVLAMLPLYPDMEEVKHRCIGPFDSEFKNSKLQLHNNQINGTVTKINPIEQGEEEAAKDSEADIETSKDQNVVQGWSPWNWFSYTETIRKGLYRGKILHKNKNLHDSPVFYQGGNDYLCCVPNSPFLYQGRINYIMLYSQFSVTK